jgi:iron complex outermembrane receptor protein
MSRPSGSLLIASATLMLAGFSAETDPISMAPFKVEAEFGIDGLRIQNSQSVLNPHLLEEHGVTQLQNVSGMAPNLYSSNSDSRGFGDVLSLRGLANSIFFGAPSVALYVDDVPGGSVSAYPSSLLNIESLTVKAGPQGTEYGRNAPGGVIDIRTRVPGAEHRGRVVAGYGSFQNQTVQGAFDGPLSARAGYSVSFGFHDREGYLDNTLLQRPADDRRAVSGRLGLYLRPTETLQLRFAALREDVRDDAPRLSSLFAADPYTVASDLNGETRIDRVQYSLQARASFAAGTLIATTSWQDWQLDPAATDLDLNPVAAALSRVVQGEEMWTQEIRFESNPQTDGGQWRAGLFFLDTTIDGDALRSFAVPPGPFVPPGFTQTERTRFAIGQTNLAAYASLDRPVTERTMLKLGIRTERAGSSLDRTKTSSNNFGFPVPPDPRLVADQSGWSVSASAGFTRAVSDSLSLLARTSLAAKPAGYSAFTGNPALARFGREEQWASEAGLTFGPPQGRFGGSLLVYWATIDGYQFERTVPNSTDFVVVNANRVGSRGVEAKFMWNPVERLWWDFQAGLTDSTFRDHLDAAGARVDGRRVPFVPRGTLRTGATLELGPGLSFNASYAAVGGLHFDERNTAMFSQGSYKLVNAQLSYRAGNWSAALHAENLLGEEYYQFINPEIFAGSPGAPRTVGVRISFEY